MTEKHKRALGVSIALVVQHELALRGLASSNLVSRILAPSGGSALLSLLALAFVLLRLCVMLLVPALLMTLFFDLLGLRIAYIRSRNRNGTP